MSAIDEATGLPEIPVGYRWLVTDSNDYGRFPSGHLIVVLQARVTKSSTMTKEVKRGWWRRPLRTQETESWTDWHYCGSELVLGYHAVAVRNAAAKLLKKQAALVDLEGLKGTYPPKRLEVAS